MTRIPTVCGTYGAIGATYHGYCMECAWLAAPYVVHIHYIYMAHRYVAHVVSTVCEWCICDVAWLHMWYICALIYHHMCCILVCVILMAQYVVHIHYIYMAQTYVAYVVMAVCEWCICDVA